MKILENLINRDHDFKCLNLQIVKQNLKNKKINKKFLTNYLKKIKINLFKFYITNRFLDCFKL